MRKFCDTCLVKILFFLLFIPFACYTQTHVPQSIDTTGKALRNDTSTFESFKLTRKKRIKYIEKDTDLRIFYVKGASTDSIEYFVGASFVHYKKDSLLVEASEFQEENYLNPKNPNFKSRTIWPTEKVKISVADINTVHRRRDGLIGSMAGGGIAALASGLIVSPLVSIEKGGFNKERFKTITIISLATIPVWITIGATFSWQKFYIKPYKRKKGGWKIEKEIS